MDFDCGFISTTRDGAVFPARREVPSDDSWRFVDGPRILGKNRTTPARTAGIQAQKMAVVVSRVDQNVVGMLSQVGSAVKPKVLRLSRRIMEVTQTLSMLAEVIGFRREHEQSTNTEHRVHSNLLLSVQIEMSELVHGQ